MKIEDRLKKAESLLKEHYASDCTACDEAVYDVTNSGCRTARELNREVIEMSKKLKKNKT